MGPVVKIGQVASSIQPIKNLDSFIVNIFLARLLRKKSSLDICAFTSKIQCLTFLALLGECKLAIISGSTLNPKSKIMLLRFMLLIVFPVG